MIELYYVEDDPNIAGMVKKYLEERDFRVTVCTTLAAARKAIEYQVPGMVLLDWNMPDGHGDGLCRWIRRNWGEVPVIFLTVRGDLRDVVDGFESGADDYVVKPFEMEVLYSRIRALLRRTGERAGRYLSCQGICVDRDRRVVICQKEEVSLTAAEYELLVYFLEQKGKTITRERLLEQVWDMNGVYVNDNTLTVTIKRLRDKLHRPPCLKTVRSVGYRMEDPL